MNKLELLKWSKELKNAFSQEELKVISKKVLKEKKAQQDKLSQLRDMGYSDDQLQEAIDFAIDSVLDFTEISVEQGKDFIDESALIEEYLDHRDSDGLKNVIKTLLTSQMSEEEFVKFIWDSLDSHERSYIINLKNGTIEEKLQKVEAFFSEHGVDNVLDYAIEEVTTWGKHENE